MFRETNTNTQMSLFDNPADLMGKRAVKKYDWAVYEQPEPFPSEEGPAVDRGGREADRVPEQLRDYPATPR